MSTQVPSNTSQHNYVPIDPAYGQSPAVNCVVSTEGVGDVPTEEVERHLEESWSGSPTNHIRKHNPDPLAAVDQFSGLCPPTSEVPSSVQSSPQSSSTISHVIEQSAFCDHRMTILTPQEVPKIKLFLQKTDGEIDFQDPLPSREFKDTTVSEFFSIFSRRSSLDISTLQSLTFVVVFANNLQLKVNRNDGERVWSNLKRRISHSFKNALAERPQQTEFEVWVVEDNDLVGF